MNVKKMTILAYAYGWWFGYPKCCTREFSKNFQNPISEERRKASHNTGLIPCTEHAQAINEGKITLESLVKNRCARSKFPNGSDCPGQYELVDLYKISRS